MDQLITNNINYIKEKWRERFTSCVKLCSAKNLWIVVARKLYGWSKLIELKRERNLRKEAANERIKK